MSKLEKVASAFDALQKRFDAVCERKDAARVGSARVDALSPSERVRYNELRWRLYHQNQGRFALNSKELTEYKVLDTKELKDPDDPFARGVARITTGPRG